MDDIYHTFLPENKFYHFFKIWNYLNETVLKTILVRKPPNWLLANSADPDQMMQNAASDQGPYCLH